MNATSLRDTPRHESRPTALLGMQVDGETCTVRTATVWPIAEVLDYQQQLDAFAGSVVGMTDADADPGLIADLLESRMIAPPRPRRRRQRAVASRAMFYAGG